MYQSKKAIEDRKEIVSIVKKLLVQKQEVELKPAIANISLETGYSKEIIREVFDTLAETGFMHVGRDGLAILTGGEKDNDIQKQ